MNGYTLISCIGTGMLKEGGYSKTLYRFPDSCKEYETSLFLDAILKTEYRSIKKVILVGTRTSSWDMLIADPDNNEDLFIKIHDECKDKSKGISADSVKALEAVLPNWYNNMPFNIIFHTDEIDQENVENIFSAYGRISELLEPNTDILFDISHSFRSMPLLIFQSFQINASKLFGKRIELIYGEYIQGEEISYVRDLSKYWDYYEISSAIKLFEEKLDGKALAEKIKPYWESGAKFLIRLTGIVECNFSLQIPDALKQLKNALKDFSENEKPQWVIDVKKILDEIFERLSTEENERYPVAKTIWEYSKLLYEKELVTQSIIALQVVVETAITEKLDPSKIGDYDWFNGYAPKNIIGEGNDTLKKIRKKDPRMSSTLGQLEGLRNQIAHGGGTNRDGAYPHQANIAGIYKNSNNAVSILFNLLDNNNL